MGKSNVVFFRLASATAMLPIVPGTSTRRSRADFCKEFDRYAGNGLMDKETMDYLLLFFLRLWELCFICTLTFQKYFCLNKKC